jgi:hypothetical protein
VYLPGTRMNPWRYWRLIEGANYGPGQPLHTLIFVTETNMETLVPGRVKLFMRAIGVSVSIYYFENSSASQ